ncbi:MAG: aminotransferase class III-fold pyridoxal phosphate-dependent enzyme [Actinomycetota bacterium]
MASVLEAEPPRFTEAAVAALVRDRFGFDGDVRNLGSERDQAFLVGDRVVKIANAAEDPAALAFEAAAIEHALGVDPELPIARQLATAVVDGHVVRVFERMPGRHGGPDLADAAVRAYGATHGRLTRALRSFFHPAAGRELLWDLKHAAKLREHARSTRRPELVAAAIDRFARIPWGRLPAQVVHGDLNLGNVLLDDEGFVTGIVDFGDSCHTARVADLAVAIASLMRGRPAGDAFRVGRLAVDGYQSAVPLEQVELDALGLLVATRLAAIVTISAWRSARYPENAAYIQAEDDDSWRLLELDGVDWSRELGGARPAVLAGALRERREAAVGALLTSLSYDAPVHVSQGRGVWLCEGERRLLDAYNNVPVVGHCHPRVVEAVVRQTRTLNTHARYLYEPLVELAERLLATMPGFDTVMLVNSGSEANDVAWRIAAGATGNDGALITHHAYHGVTAAIADVSPEEWPRGYAAPHVVRMPASLETGTLPPLAATFLDAGLTSDGIRPATREAAQALVRATHAAGGLFVADEVQIGHGRSGEGLWMYRHLGLEPDLVTLGKPMGNGYPVAAVITRREVLERFDYAGTVFSTFGGNPVAAQAALAVLDVIEDERLVAQAQRVGGLLRERIRGLGHPAIVDVRGVGQLTGVELDSPERAKAVVDGMRREGVLIGRTGPQDDVLKIRPPLVFDDSHVETLLNALERSLH